GTVQFVAAARTMLDGPETALAVQCRSLEIAVAEAPDLRQCILMFDERIVGKRLSGCVDAEDLAEPAREFLGLYARAGVGALADRHIEFALFAENQPRAEMLVA